MSSTLRNLFLSTALVLGGGVMGQQEAQPKKDVAPVKTEQATNTTAVTFKDIAPPEIIGRGEVRQFTRRAMRGDQPAGSEGMIWMNRSGTAHIVAQDIGGVAYVSGGDAAAGIFFGLTRADHLLKKDLPDITHADARWRAVRFFKDNASGSEVDLQETIAAMSARVYRQTIEEAKRYKGLKAGDDDKDGMGFVAQILLSTGNSAAFDGDSLMTAQQFERLATAQGQLFPEPQTQEQKKQFALMDPGMVMIYQRQDGTRAAAIVTSMDANVLHYLGVLPNGQIEEKIIKLDDLKSAVLIDAAAMTNRPLLENDCSFLGQGTITPLSALVLKSPADAPPAVRETGKELTTPAAAPPTKGEKPKGTIGVQDGRNFHMGSPTKPAKTDTVPSPKDGLR